MERTPEEIVANIIDDMIEADGWISVADATAANDINASYASWDEVYQILLAVKNSGEIVPGSVGRRFYDLPPDWIPKVETDKIFRAERPISAMMSLSFRLISWK